MVEMERKSVTFATKDRISIFISCCALLLTFINFYFTNIRIENLLLARVANDFKYPGLGTNCDTILIQVVFINSGNRQTAILGTHYNMSTDSSKMTNTIYFPFENEDIFPMILEPHQMKVAMLRLPLSKMYFSTPKAKIDTEVTYKEFMMLRYSAWDVDGTEYLESTKYLFSYEMLNFKLKSIYPATEEYHDQGYPTTIVVSN